ncbi:MAG: LPS-assembly protein LptD [Coraliomargaritaceae bacterium]
MFRTDRLLLLFCCFQLSFLSLWGALPELSSIEPIEYDEASQRLVARGDALLEIDGTRLEADQITYYQEFGLADAEGTIALDRDGYRLLADRLSYDSQNQIFSVSEFRSGRWPFYLEGATAGGSAEEVRVEGGTLYYGNPGPFSVNVSADKVDYTSADGGEIRLEKTTFRIGRVPFFHLPAYTQALNQPPYYLEVDGGFDEELGLHLQTTSLIPVQPWLRLGANFDLYTERGVLVGPTAQYLYNSDTQRIQGAINTGYIQDQGDTGVDSLERAIDKERSFIEVRHKHHLGERVTVTASASYWSDSEVTRDFRDDYFEQNRRPDNFVEGVYAGDHFVVTAFSRFNPNDFDLVQERLPEVRLDVLPLALINTGAYHQGSVSYARLREDFSDLSPLLPDPSETDRVDLNYRIQRPIRLTNWLTFSPLAGARMTHYENQVSAAGNLPNGEDSATRDLYEVGFDLEARAHAVYPTQNKIWGVDGLRHLVRPVMRYRYYSEPDEDDAIVAIEREVFDTNRPVLDLGDLRHTDQIEQQHLLRVGVENRYQTRAGGGAYGSRDLAELNFYQDILFERGQRANEPDERQETFHASWIEFILSPAAWLRFDLATRLRTESLNIEEIRTRTALVSGEIWEMGFSTDFLEKQIEQYVIDFVQRLNERYTLLLDARFDANTNELVDSRIGLITRLGSAWEIIYALTFRDRAARESDLEFDIAVRLLRP